MDVLVFAMVGIALVAVVVLVTLFRMSWRVAEPDEALIISGFRAGSGPGGSGEHGVPHRDRARLPGRAGPDQGAPNLPRSARIQIVVPCVSRQKINLQLTGVVMYKVGDDYASIANAARRFLDRPADELETKVQNVFIGHLRAIAGSMTVEDMISDQDKFSEQVRDRCSHEMESFGLVIDSFQIQSIASESNYIANLAVPHQVEVEQQARIARALAEREAIAQEQQAQAQVALSVRDTQIKKAGYQAEVDRATKESQQQGLLAEATARQAVVEVATKVAQLEAQQKEQQLQVEVRKPADAEAYRQTTLATATRDARIRQAEADAQETRLRAEAAAAQTKMQALAEAEAIKVRAAAQAEATRLNGQAEADAIQARGLAEAEAVRARMAAEAAGIQQRAEAMSKNQEAVIAQQVAENLPEIVAAAAKPFEHVGQFTVLNGAQGVTSALAEIIQQAGTLTSMARESLLPALKVDANGGTATNGEVTPSA